MRKWRNQASIGVFVTEKQEGDILGVNRNMDRRTSEKFIQMSQKHHW